MRALDNLFNRADLLQKHSIRESHSMEDSTDGGMRVPQRAVSASL